MTDRGFAARDFVRTWQGEGTSLSSFVGAHADEIEQTIASRGAALFRGFETPTDEEFRSVLTRFGGQVLEYSERSSPRSEISDRVYSSTEYPADQEIFFHNENSYQVSWPRLLGFVCRQPAVSGGATPLSDCRAVLARLSERVVEKFLSLGWSYVRNFHPGLGLPWQEVFRSSDKAEVDRYCGAHGLSTHWLGESHLRVTSDARPAIRPHPTTGEPVWFNHVAFFHYSTLPSEVAEVLFTAMDVEDLPSNTYYGTGEPIDLDVLAEIRNAYNNEAQIFPWERDDVLLIDNMLIAHGRQSFIGDRRISVSMAGMVELSMAGPHM